MNNSKVKIVRFCLLFATVLALLVCPKFTEARPRLKSVNNKQITVARDANNRNDDGNTAESDSNNNQLYMQKAELAMGQIVAKHLQTSDSLPNILNGSSVKGLLKKVNETYPRLHHLQRLPHHLHTLHNHHHQQGKKLMVNSQDSTDNQDIDDDGDLHGLPQLWNYGIVPYEISHRLYKHRELIEQVMRHIGSNAACVQFLKRNDDIWEDYIEIELNDNDQRCRAHVGRQGGHQKVMLSTVCLNFGTILHELMHVLGFYHEHTRPDRDQYLEIEWQNIDPDSWHNFEMIKMNQFRNLTEFNYDSIMMYDEYSFSDNGRPTMLARDPTVMLTNPKEKKRLSHLDIYALQQLYCN